jgi:hypothetical protein
VRITGQLIDATNGAHLWADHFDGSLEDVFDLQDKVASSVAGVIEPELLTAGIARSAHRSTTDLTAYDTYLGRPHGGSPRCFASSSKQSRAIRITGRRSPWRPCAVSGWLSTAAAKTPRRTA